MADETDRGPSWYDVGVRWEETWKEWGVFVELGLVPPTPRIDGRGYTTWAVSVRLLERGGTHKLLRGFNRPFGRGGAARTATTALWWALDDAVAWLEERKDAAERQATF